jgi:hypothetical protein
MMVVMAEGLLMRAEVQRVLILQTDAVMAAIGERVVPDRLHHRPS